MRNGEQYIKIKRKYDLWSIQSLTQEALMIQQGNSNRVGMGIKEPPIWDFIPVHKILVPVLHILLGLGNDVLAKFWQCLRYLEKNTSACD